MAAICTLKQIEADCRNASPKEQDTKYVGWGGVADAFEPGKPEWAAEYTMMDFTAGNVPDMILRSLIQSRGIIEKRALAV